MKKSYIILIVAVIIAAAVWLIERPDRSPVVNFEPFILYPNIDGSTISVIEIEHLINGSRLKKSGDEWKVSPVITDMAKQIMEKEGGDGVALETEFKADSKKVFDIIEKLKNLQAKSLASMNPEKQSIYQVGGLAKHIKLFDANGGKIADLYIGKEGSDMFTTYVRRDGEDEVYLVGEHIGATVPSDVMGWRDREIWNIDPDFIMGVKIKNSGKEYSLSKEDQGGWQLIKPESMPVDGEKVKRFLENIGKLSAARFAHELDKEKTGLTDPALTLEIITVDGKGHMLIVGGEDKQGYLYAHSSDGNDIYMVDSNFGSKIPSDWSEFMPSPKK